MSLSDSTSLINHFPTGSLACKTFEMTKMDCSKRSLLEVPVLDQNFTTILDLSYNFLNNITNAPFEKLKQLLMLDLSYNEISYLSATAFEGLHSLERLMLKHNKLVGLPKDVFSNLSNLVDLNLDDNYYTAIPGQALAPLQSLQVLSFINADEDIHEIDLEGFQNLSALKTIYFVIWNLESNISATALHPLENLPLESFSISWWWKGSPCSISKEMFAPLTGIMYLTIPFSALPAMVSLHTPLQLLTISPDIHVKVLDENSLKILQKFSLTILTVRLGVLKKVEDHTFIWTPHLVILDLDNNEINHLAKDAFYGLNSLQTLTLSRNFLADLPSDALQIFRKSLTLLHLDLSSNRITEPIDNNVFPSSLRYLSLDISYKSTFVSTHWIASLQNLKKLTLTVDSGIILESTESVESLKTLHMRTIGLMTLASTLCSFFPTLEAAVMTDMNFNDKASLLKALQLQTCFFLKELDLSGVVIKHNSVDFDSLNMLNVTISNLEILKLTQNKLSSIKLIFFIKAPKLANLDLAENQITTIDSEIADKYPGLITLNVQDNEIASLSGLKQLAFLQNLYAAGNKITDVPTWLVSEARYLKTLDLRNSPFGCNCNIKPLRKWILSDKQTWLQPGQYVCASPENLKLKSITSIELDCRSKTPFYLSVTIPSVLLFFIVIMILFRYRWHIKYKLFLLYRNYRPFPDIADDFEMLQLQYHAYVAYNERDEAWVMNDLQPNMEEGPEPLRLCIKSRDFIPGHFLLDSINESIHQSRKTILVLSRNFVDSEWCYHEMRMAQMRLLDDNLDILVLVLLNEIPENKMTLSLRQILCRKDYIKWPKDRAGQNLFWRRLRQELKGPIQVDRCFNF